MSRFDPTSGPSGTVVTVGDKAFTGAHAVTVGGVAATSFTVVDERTLQLTVPAGGGEQDHSR